ncbi:MAG: SDR family oxidoreductase [Candidatus Competibacteraceae bacterium]|nr:SDR family oxidoreductase [Candidatus Competibacteraceae bacterium]
MTNPTHSKAQTDNTIHSDRPVLVFGASGYVGTHLVPRLLEQAYKVRAAARNRAVLETRQWSNVDLVEADALKPETLDAALAGVDVAFYLVHSMAAGKQFGRLDEEAAANFARAAERAGVRRIVYLGGLIPKDADSEHLVSRQVTGERLRAGSVPVTEIRAGIIVGPGSAAFEVMRDLVCNLPIMITPRWVRSQSTPIALDNLLDYLIGVAELPEAAGGIYDAAGPEMLSYQQMMRQFGEIVGKRCLVIPVPVLSPGLSSYWLSLVTTVPYNIARALIGGLKHDIPADDRPLRALIPQQLLNFRESINAALETERRNAVAARWTEGALMFRDYRSDYAFYAKKAGGSAVTSASAQAVWDQVAAIGGKNRYYYLNPLWTLRELLDWLAGGPGLNHSRRHPTAVRLGDIIDSWRVVGLEPERRLTLQFGMKAPGAGVLEFEIDPEEDGRTRVTATAYWHPAGVWGLLYWYSLEPFHLIIFKGLTRAIAERAEQAEA